MAKQTVSENAALKAQVATLKAQNANLTNLLAAAKSNDLNWAVLQLLEIGRIVGLPAEKQLSDIVEWVRTHWKP